jgi:hypothetical protein
MQSDSGSRIRGVKKVPDPGSATSTGNGHMLKSCFIPCNIILNLMRIAQRWIDKLIELVL